MSEELSVSVNFSIFLMISHCLHAGITYNTIIFDIKAENK